MKRAWSTLGQMAGAAALAVGGLAGCNRNSPVAAQEPPAIAVRIAPVAIADVPSWVEITGTVRAVDRALLAAKLMGAIEELPVTLGQRVRAGDVLVRISAGEVGARVAQARALLDGARRDLERERGLLAQGASAAESARSADDRVKTLEASLREAEILAGYAVVRAPFDGVIARRLANAGDLATPGMPLLEVHGETAFEIDAAVPETLAAALQVGSEVAVALPASRGSFTGKVAEISSAADPEARAVPLKISVPRGTAVRSGQFTRLQIPGAVRRTLLAPVSAVDQVGQMERVFIVGADGRAALRLVRTGFRPGDLIEVLSGLEAGDRVVLSPPPNLGDGQRVEARP